MRTTFVHAALHCPGPVGHRHVLADVDLEHDRRREIPDHPVDVGVHGFAVKQRHIEQEPVLGRPAADGVGEDRGQRHRRGDAAGMGSGDQPALGFRRQPMVIPNRAVGRASVTDQRDGKFRCSGHLGQTPLPPLPVPLPLGIAVLIPLALDAVALVAVTRSNRLGPAIQFGQIGDQHAITHRVTGQHVDVQVQPAAVLVIAGQGDVNDLAVFDCQPLMCFSIPHVGQRGIGSEPVLTAQIDQAEHRAARPWHRLLSSVRQKAGTKHGMSGDEIGYRPLQPVRIDCPTIEFDVEVGCHPAQFLFVGSADPVRVLHGSQRERRVFVERRFVPGRGGRHPRRFSAEQGMPRADRWAGSQLCEGDGGTALSPASSHRHHADRVQPQLNEIVMVCDVLGRAAELGRDRGPDLVPADPLLAEHR